MRFLVSILLIASAGSLHAAPGGLHVKVPMRDGVRLSTNVFVPPANGRFPAILIRTPYGKGNDVGTFRSFLDRGFAVVVQDVRGRRDSAGDFQPLTQEGPDGSDTLDWIARQDWSDGSVGMLGGSYLGIAQWRVAMLNNPHLKAIFPVVSGIDDYRDRFYSPGGAFKLGHRLQWMADNLRAKSFQPPEFAKFIFHLPLRTADRLVTGQSVEMFQAVMDHPLHDGFWDAISVLDNIREIRIPVFSAAGWYDNFAQSDLAAFSQLSRRSTLHHIVIGPWPHNMSTPLKTVNFGPDSSAPIRRFQHDWFEYWLKTPERKRVRKPFSYPPVRLFVMGANVWRDEKEWPLARARVSRLYLNSTKGANSKGGDGELLAEPPRRERADIYTYDPRKPVPTLGGAVCCNDKVFPWGPMDQRPVERRRDVIVYTGKPLAKDLEVTGTVKAVLYVATSARDTDFTAKLVDVYPDGRAINLTDGILRLRYRESLERAVLAQPGTVYTITVDMGVTSNVFKAGHSIRLEVSSSNFPRFDRNLNTGRAQADETELRVATQSVFHGRLRPSHLLLPVVEAK